MGWEQVNTQKASWLRPKEDVSEEEYNSLYKTISKDYMDPLSKIHFTAEGEIEFKSILYVPKSAPTDMLDNYWTKKSEIKLYVRRVLVADKFEELLPGYLNFVRGVVDSDDLPLNVSREALQQSKIMKVISKKLIRKVLELLKKLSKESEDKEDDEEEEESSDAAAAGEGEEGDKEAAKEKKEKKAKSSKDGEESTYAKFYKEFGKNLKMGCYEDDSNRSKISKLLRFKTTKSDGKEISLDKYLDQMPEKQNQIYYISGESIETLSKLPNLQMFKKKNIEVLLLTDHLDEPCLQKLADYEGKKFVSVQKEGVTLDETEDEAKRFKRLEAMYKPLTSWWTEQLTHLTTKGAMKDTGVKIDGVSLSKRLTESPVVVVTSQFGYSAHQEKIMRAQAFQNKDQMQMMAGRKTLEINPNHPVIVDLLSKVKENKENPKAISSSGTLFQAALIESGYDISDPSDFTSRIYKLMSSELGVDPDAAVAEVELPPEEEEEAEAESEEEETTTEEEETEDSESAGGEEKKEEL